MKVRPLPQASHLDDPFGEASAQLLEARIRTLEDHGKDAMSPMDIKNGYSPFDIMRFLDAQIAFIRDNSPNMIKIKKTKGGGIRS
tara:strand:- start:811 stop:1065 length:255 start_codon:yes stop_codon:yes gene_type:complete